MKDRIIRARRANSQAWYYVAPDGALLADPDRAERMDANGAARRIIQYINDYPGWQFDLTGDGIKIIILETGNIEEIKKGRPASSPDGSVVVAWTPDPVWLADKIAETGGDAEAIGKLIDEASKRPQKPINRPKHQPHEIRFEKGESK